MKRLRILGALGVLIIVLFGCGKGQTDAVQETEQSGSAVNYENWKEEGFVLEEISATQELADADGELYHEVFYKELENTEPDLAYESNNIVTGYYADMVYTYTSYQTEGETRCFLEKKSIQGEESQVTEVQLPAEIHSGYAIDIDVVSVQKYYVLFATTAVGGNVAENLYVLELDAQGIVSKAVKLTEDFLQQEEDVACSLFMIDEQGYVFLVNSRSTKMYIHDAEGKLVLQKEYADDYEDTVRGGFHMPDGSVILLVGNYGKASTDLVWYDMSSSQPKMVQTLDGAAISNACMTEEGCIYYMSTSRVYAWNVSTGKQTKLFDCMLNNIDYGQIDALTVTTGSEIALHCTQFGKTSVYVFSNEVVQVEEDGISMVFLDSADPYLKTTVAGFSRKYPDMAITIETDSGDKDAYHDRIMAELVAGKGPELLWVDVEDMQILYEKGAIMPITDLVKEETLAQVFSGILKSGSVGAELVGLYFDAMPTTFVVNKALLNKEEWTVADLNCVAAENPQLKGLMTSAFNFEEASQLSILALNNLENCKYLDFESNQSNFNCEEFVELLNYLKQYGPSQADGNGLQQVCDGEYLTYRASIEVRNLVAFSEVMAQCEETCLLMGFPGSGQYLGCWMQDSFLVVNAATENKEAAAKFLEYALSLTAQRECTKGSVRRDVISTQVYIHEYLGTYVYGSGAQELALKENGETYLEDYLVFLDNCAPLPHSYEAIENIVLEEVDMFFHGNYTAEHVAENIDNRVQLYLDEQN